MLVKAANRVDMIDIVTAWYPSLEPLVPKLIGRLFSIFDLFVPAEWTSVKCF